MTAIERQIQQIYQTVYKQVFKGQNLTALTRNNRQPADVVLSQLEMSQKYDEFAMKFAQALAKKGLRNQKGVWRKYYDAARRSRIIALTKTWSQFEADVMTQAIAHNFTMIKSIPQSMKKVLYHKYTSTLIAEVAKGQLTRGSFARMLAQHGNKQAKLIARTETAKLQTAILENRATQLGSIVYRWLASNDKRTRPSHRQMNGVIVWWQPPNGNKPLLDNMRGSAGEFPNCRCSPEPILDEDDLTDNWYRVYDYNNDTIIRMSRKRLLEAINRGAL